jgi:predicted nucleic acid-binding protein
LNAIVIDASITAAWCFEDEQTEYARHLLKRSKDLKLYAPAIWPLEMANVLVVNERKKRITSADTVQFVKLLNELDIQVDRPPVMQPFDATLLLARTYNLSAYDAAYLELALREGVPLATLDNQLRQAAVTAGVAVHA